METTEIAGKDILKGLLLLALASLLTGCAAVAPVTSLIGGLNPNSPGVQAHSETLIRLEQANYQVVKTNVVGSSKGFSLLGLLTIHPASLATAMDRMYGAAQMQPGRPQTFAHLIIEYSRSHWILFAIPRIEVRADVVEFIPVDTTRESSPPRRRHPERKNQRSKPDG